MGAERSLSSPVTTGAVSMTETVWTAPRELMLAQWLDYGRRLGVLGRGVAWWIGDWLIYGNERYGEKYVRASRVTGYDTQTLMNMCYVASRFAPERRRATLSWSHHAELSALAQEEQERWLDVAETERLSVHSLRLELRSAKRRRVLTAAAGDPTAEADDDTTHGKPTDVVCPRCHHLIEVPEAGSPRGSTARVGTR